MSELKPCPFCGGEAEVTTSLHGYVASCIDCYAQDNSVEIAGISTDDAVKAWNTRQLPGGMVMVPEKPMRNQLFAGAAALSGGHCTSTSRDDAHKVYKAMIKAAEDGK